MNERVGETPGPLHQEEAEAASDGAEAAPAPRRRAAPATSPFVEFFRASAPYIHAHRGRTFVVMFGGEAVVDHDFPFGGFAAEVCTQITERAFASLQRAPLRLCFPDRSMPSSGVLERVYYPDQQRIAAAIAGLCADDVLAPGLAREVVSS